MEWQQGFVKGCDQFSSRCQCYRPLIVRHAKDQFDHVISWQSLEARASSCMSFSHRSWANSKAYWLTSWGPSPKPRSHNAPNIVLTKCALWLIHKVCVTDSIREYERTSPCITHPRHYASFSNVRFLSRCTLFVDSQTESVAFVKTENVLSAFKYCSIIVL